MSKLYALYLSAADDGSFAVLNVRPEARVLPGLDELQACEEARRLDGAKVDPGLPDSAEWVADVYRLDSEPLENGIHELTLSRQGFPVLRCFCGPDGRCTREATNDEQRVLDAILDAIEEHPDSEQVWRLIRAE